MHVRREAGAPPLVFAGARDQLLTIEAAQQPGVEFLMDPWEVDEALMRLSLALLAADR